MKRKWKPNKKEKEEFKAKLWEQEKQLAELINCYQSEIKDAYWNDNKSSLYLFLNNGNSYRISTHHLPNKDWNFKIFGIGEKYRNCSFVQKEIVTNSRNNIIRKAFELLENSKKPEQSKPPKTKEINMITKKVNEKYEELLSSLKDLRAAISEFLEEAPENLNYVNKWENSSNFSIWDLISDIDNTYWIESVCQKEGQLREICDEIEELQVTSELSKLSGQGGRNYGAKNTIISFNKRK